MRHSRACAAAVVALALGPAAPAWSDEEPPPAAPETPAEPAPDPTAGAKLPASARPAEEPRSTDHYHQFGASARIGVGLRGIATYDDTDYCGKRSTDTASGNAAVCISRAPMSLDFEAAYGFSHGREVLLEFRIGLERDFGAVTGSDGPRVHFLAPGVRFFFNEAKTSKLFTQGQLVLDFSSYDDASGQGRGVDFGVRNLNGLWFDLHHAYGFYVYVGETLTFKRWIMGDLEAGIGIQGRYP